MAECLCAGRKLLVCGNGGSAADGADFSAEFGCRFVTDRRPYPALNLAQGGSLMSAIGNDYGYDEVFARQVAGLGQKGDVLVAITTSGNSKHSSCLKGHSGANDMALLVRSGGPRRMAEIELLGAAIRSAIQEGQILLTSFVAW